MEQSDFWASGITFSSLKELWVCELTQVLELRKNLWLSLMMTKIRSNPAFFSFFSFLFFFLSFFGDGVGGVEPEQGGRNWAIGIDMYTLMCVKLMPNKNLQYKKTKTFPQSKLKP